MLCVFVCVCVYRWYLKMLMSLSASLSDLSPQGGDQDVLQSLQRQPACLHDAVVTGAHGQSEENPAHIVLAEQNLRQSQQERPKEHHKPHGAVWKQASVQETSTHGNPGSVAWREGARLRK